MPLAQGTTISFRAPPGSAEIFDLAAREIGVTRSELVRRAVDAEARRILGLDNRASRPGESGQQLLAGR